MFDLKLASLKRTQRELPMIKAILIAAGVAALSIVTAFDASAQTTGPAAQQDTMAKDKMGKDKMGKHGMKKQTKGMSKDGMAKDGMSKDSMSKDGMKKDGMSK
jgi:pentapeptide MXKDX repeat protein